MQVVVSVKVATALKLSNGSWMIAVVGGAYEVMPAANFVQLIGNTYFIIDPLADRAIAGRQQRDRTKFIVKVCAYTHMP